MLRCVLNKRFLPSLIKSRAFIATPILNKRIVNVKLSEFKVNRSKPEKLDKLPDHVEISTGSIVLDTVRAYTKKYPLCVLLVQVGDFYELYESHATLYASQLDLKLTKKLITANTVVDFAGFPSRSLDRYLDILVNKLQCKVALCEQLGPVSREDKSIVGMQRRITRIITPGTVIEDRFLDSNQYNYLLSIFPNKDFIGLAWVDISVGEFIMQRTTLVNLKNDLARIGPREVILPESMRPSDAVLEQGLIDQDAYDPITKMLVADSSIAISYEPAEHYDAYKAGRTLHSMFKRFSETAPNFSNDELAAGMALILYVNETHVDKKLKWQMPIQFNINESVRIDSAAMTSLELLKSLQGKRMDSLLGTLDHTSTSAGSRLLTRWITSPLTSISEIRRRLDIVEFFTNDIFLLKDIRSLLRQSTDAQRALQRLALKRGQHSDLLEILYTLDVIQSIHSKLKLPEALKDFMIDMDPHRSISSYIKDAFDYEQIQSKGNNKEYGFVNHAFHPELSNLHHELNQLETKRLNLQTELRELCGNSLTLLTEGSLKHIIEVNARQAHNILTRFPNAIPFNHTKSKHRFQVEEWTDISIRLENIQSQIIEIENKIFTEVVDRVLDHSTTILQSCRKLAQLDVLTCFAHIAHENNYVRPRITQTNRTMIMGGRHPVVEANLARKGRMFVANDCDVQEKQRIWLLTGPNMGGKSTFLRQYAIIVLMAHIGSFVPANRAWIGVTDRIFSRVGAADNLAQNQSTFMVEMSEVSTILQQATEKSTVIMDEVGRGTSTKDGFSLAYGVLDYLHNHIKCRTLFATHYHELADATSNFSNIKCYQTSLEEDQDGGFRLDHKVQPGVCRQSHGIKVARIAGLPDYVINKANDMWNSLQVSQSLISSSKFKDN
ncbi:DNA mismatch repair protein MutS [Cokeromyces recurvatus]|uniref:DNA mismatch repair protein MutS n=1 Tax=Cokeromyces recurvatus TaxID=90255 RepID=UPI00221EB1D2|nr:DNA mismatch repair protein MutS [Cokeromyces recurvatus]KAI7900807.1 DNA mismatch repair protein MutS [Cokeromyces recurvatus]